MAVKSLLNGDDTEMLITGLKQKLKKVGDLSLNFSDTSKISTQTAGNLDFTFDNIHFASQHA